MNTSKTPKPRLIIKTLKNEKRFSCVKVLKNGTKLPTTMPLSIQDTIENFDNLNNSVNEGWYGKM